MREIEFDINEGADIIMVKPAIPISRFNLSSKTEY